jgi:hypothetical protein
MEEEKTMAELQRYLDGLKVDSSDGEEFGRS